MQAIIPWDGANNFFVEYNSYLCTTKKMASAIIRYLIFYLAFVVVFILQKPLFMCFYAVSVDGISVADWWTVVWHGLTMDLAMAGYCSVIPGLLLIASVWVRQHRWPESALWVYMLVMAIVIAIITVLDLILYGYWGFRLDMTPIFYFSTSPSAALASVGIWEIIGGILAVGVVLFLAWLVFSYPLKFKGMVRSRRVMTTVALALMTGLLFIPIRGGVTVSTMNLSRAYFSDTTLLNHAAINPMFSLMYSALHQGDFDSQYRYMDDEELTRQLTELNGDKSSKSINGKVEGIEDVYLIILESFSAHLMPSLGGEPIAMRLDSIAREGVLYTNFYANSFRTDRAIPSILSGFPASPSLSIMKYVEKAEHLPSITRSLKDNGFNTTYYYGGDANFTNMLAYLVSQGFDRVVSDKDFPLSKRLSKWGAHDGEVFEKAINELPSQKSPKFTVIQTSSSHEPFDVPSTLRGFEAGTRQNAFAYADSCMGAFVNVLKKSPRWKKTLIVIVPDHWGGYPQHLNEPLQRHHVPLVMTGGALKDATRHNETPGSQIDIAATLLAMLGLPHGEFEFSKDLNDNKIPHYGVFTEKEIIGLVKPTQRVVYNIERVTANDNDSLTRQAQAFLQHLHYVLSKL